MDNDDENMFNDSDTIINTCIDLTMDNINRKNLLKNKFIWGRLTSLSPEKQETIRSIIETTEYREACAF